MEEIAEELEQQASKGKGRSTEDNAPEPKMKHKVGGQVVPLQGVRRGDGARGHAQVPGACAHGE